MRTRTPRTVHEHNAKHEDHKGPGDNHDMDMDWDGETCKRGGN